MDSREVSGEFGDERWGCGLEERGRPRKKIEALMQHVIYSK